MKLREKMARENAHVVVCIVGELYVSSCLFVCGCVGLKLVCTYSVAPLW